VDRSGTRGHRELARLRGLRHGSPEQTPAQVLGIGWNRARHRPTQASQNAGNMGFRLLRVHSRFRQCGRPERLKFGTVGRRSLWGCNAPCWMTQFAGAA
jgi:hypothetical protein